MGKLEDAYNKIGKYDSALIAFSGGVDSTFLAIITSKVLGERILLATVSSPLYPTSELEQAEKLAAEYGLRHKIIVVDALAIPGFAANTPERCYFCKHALFSRLGAIAQEEHLAAVFEGSTVDDLSDYRPGHRAIKELNIVSPLLEAGLSKTEIRSYSAQMNLITAYKPSYACLASRFPYGETITREKLKRVETAEDAMRKYGFMQFRVRSHENCARIEVAPDEMEHAWNNRTTLREICIASGFTFTALDLKGYRSGAMNEVLTIKKNNL